MTVNLDNIIEIDCLNMAAVFESTANKFKPELRRKGLLKEIDKGAEFVIIERNGILIGYLEYVPDGDGEIYVASIQLHPDFKSGFVLRQILSKTYDKLKNSFPTAIKSSVHKTNLLSQKLHEKLGFVNIGKNKERYFFKAEGKDLKKKLAFYAKD